MIRWGTGTVVAITGRREGLEELLVRMEEGEIPAVNYPALTGPALPGDKLLLNTTARYLELGTGGVHFVAFNYSHRWPPFGGKGHIMKLRYTPWQVRVLSCEEEAAGYRTKLAAFRGLKGMPVLIGELHSMLVPAAVVLKSYAPGLRLAYIMTDGGALPLSFSWTVARLRSLGLIDATVTCGHAFGGDLEAVNVYSALAACREIVAAEAVIITMGPGNVGTGSTLGFSGMEVGEHINRVNALQGCPVIIPRISFADPRSRHRGLSHHTLTALELGAFSAARLPLPRAEPPLLGRLLRQLARRRLLGKHRLEIWPAPPLATLWQRWDLPLPASMGRSYQQDALFFDAAGAAALCALNVLRNHRSRTGLSGGNERGRAVALPRCKETGAMPKLPKMVKGGRDL